MYDFLFYGPLYINFFNICFDRVVIAAKFTATFSDLLCSPNLGITRMWICRLNFAQRPVDKNVTYKKFTSSLGT